MTLTQQKTNAVAEEVNQSQADPNKQRVCAVRFSDDPVQIRKTLKNPVRSE